MIIDTTLVLILVFLFFTLLAFIVKDVFIFAIAGFASLLLGLDLAILYLAEPEGWAIAIVGFALILFGFYLLVAALTYSLPTGGKQQK